MQYANLHSEVKTTNIPMLQVQKVVPCRVHTAKCSFRKICVHNLLVCSELGLHPGGALTLYNYP